MVGEEEYTISSGDQFYMIEDMDVATFMEKTPGGGGYRSVVTLKAGDIITYLRRDKMILGAVTPMDLFKFKASILDDDGTILSEIIFMIKNPDSLIKWAADF